MLLKHTFIKLKKVVKHNLRSLKKKIYIQILYRFLCFLSCSVLLLLLCFFFEYFSLSELDDDESESLDSDDELPRVFFLKISKKSI